MLVALVLFPTIGVISTRDILPKQLQHANLTLGMPALPSERSHARSMIVSPHVLNQIMQSWCVNLPAESLLLVCRGVIDTCTAVVLKNMAVLVSVLGIVVSHAWYR